MKTYWRGKFYAWLDGRLISSHEVVLKQKNIYILPSAYGFLMAVIVILILVAATNYQNNLAFLTGFVLISIGFLSMFYTFRNLAGLVLSAGPCSPVFAGETASFTVSLSSVKPVGHYSVGVGASKSALHYFDMEPGTEFRVEVPQVSAKRGWLTFSRVLCASRFPFGTFRVFSWQKLDARCLVYPRPIQPDETLLARVGQGEGDSHERPGVEDYWGHRGYRPGDSKRQIDWKAYARERGLHSREFVESAGSSWLFRISDFAHVDPELALSWLCYLVVHAERSNQIYGLELTGTRIEHGRGDEHLARCLQALALHP